MYVYHLSCDVNSKANLDEFVKYRFSGSILSLGAIIDLPSVLVRYEEVCYQVTSGGFIED